MAIAAPFPSVRMTAARMPARPAQARRPVRLTRRGKAVIVGTVVAAALAGLVATGSEVGASSQAHDAGTTAVVVQPGESVWTIARTRQPGADPRALVAQIRELNHLVSGVVVPGQTLVVPA